MSNDKMVNHLAYIMIMMADRNDEINTLVRSAVKFIEEGKCPEITKSQLNQAADLMVSHAARMEACAGEILNISEQI